MPHRELKWGIPTYMVTLDHVSWDFREGNYGIVEGNRGNCRMDASQWVPVELYLQTQVVSGLVYHPQEDRLVDILSSVSVRRLENRGKFLELSQVTIQHTDGKEEKLPIAYIKKASIHLAATFNPDSARGLGAKAGVKPYPFVEKSPVPVRLRTSAYALTGSTHRASHQRMQHVIEAGSMFLPLTNVDIRSLASNTEWKAPFAAVNKEQIVSLQEEGGPVLMVHTDNLSEAQDVQ